MRTLPALLASAAALAAVASLCPAAVRANDPKPTAPAASAPDAPRIAPGRGSFVFTDDGPGGDPTRPITVFYHLPAGVDVRKARVLFVMHGTLRNGEEYRDQWATLAERYGVLLLVPQFSRDAYPGGMYNRGNVRGRDDEAPQPPEKWSFPVIERVFDRVKKMTGSRAKEYDLYGHSAGGQFVHRLALFLPDARYRRAVAANAGYYTLPKISGEADYPFSLAGTPADAPWLKRVLGRELVILLGEEDTDPKDPDLYHSPEADRQGMHRFARGKSFYAAGESAARESKARCRWRVVTVPGVGHSNEKMAAAAARALYGPPPKETKR